MAIDVIMPKVDMDMASGRISKWHVKAGDRVAKGAALFEIETDKAAMEIEAPADGIVASISAQEGATIPVGQTVARIFAAGETIPEAVPTADLGPRATPLARRLAREAGLALATLTGSGPRGRIVADDVRRALETAPPAKTVAPPVPLAPETTDVVPLDAMRRTIAQRLTLSKQTVPHFYLTSTCTIDALLDCRTRLNASAPKGGNGQPQWKLSINDFVIKAFALALQRVPQANVTWNGDSILQHRTSDIGVAVAVDGGLFTPVMRAAESKTLSAISREMKDLAARARARKLAPAEYQGGSASISNLGMLGVEHFTAIINPPQATILAVGATVERFVPVNRQPMLKTQMACTLSCDHRAVDGAIGAALLQAFRAMLEDPALMLV